MKWATKLTVPLCATVLLVLIGPLDVSKADSSAIPCRSWSKEDLKQEENRDVEPVNLSGMIPMGGGVPAFWLSSTSVACGDEITVHLAYPYKTYLEIYRVGTYTNSSFRLVSKMLIEPGANLLADIRNPSKDVSGLPASVARPKRIVSPIDNLPAFVSASAISWPAVAQIKIDGSFVPGAYIVSVRTRSNNVIQTGQPLIIKDFSRQHELGLLAPTFTWQAYNEYGVASLYSYPDKNGKYSNKYFADGVYFSRPLYAITGINNPMQTFVLWSRLMSQSDSDFTWLTSEDLNAKAFAFPFNSLVVSSHDEYWTVQMRRNVDINFSKGKNILIFGGNTMYRKAAIDSRNGLLMVRKFRNSLHKGDRAYNKSSLWIDLKPKWPQSKTIGLKYGCQTSMNDHQDYKVKDTKFWAWASLKPPKDFTIPNILGYEFDSPDSTLKRNQQYPAQGLGKCVDSLKGKKLKGSFTYFTDERSKAGVINVGTTGWLYGTTYALGMVPKMIISSNVREFVTKTTIKILQEGSKGPLGEKYPVVK